MRFLLATAFVCLVLAGCLNQGQPQPLASDSTASATTAPAPVTQSWAGHIVVSQLGALAHNRDTEPLVMPLHSEGFVFEVMAPPKAMQVQLHWPGPGTALMMMSTPHKDGKGFEYFSKPGTDLESCIAIPPADIVPGSWQVMVHTQDSMNADFTFDVTTVGGLAHVVEGQPHSSAEAAQSEEREALPCAVQA